MFNEIDFINNLISGQNSSTIITPPAPALIAKNSASKATLQQLTNSSHLNGNLSLSKRMIAANNKNARDHNGNNNADNENNSESHSFNGLPRNGAAAVVAAARIVMNGKRLSATPSDEDSVQSRSPTSSADVTINNLLSNHHHHQTQQSQQPTHTNNSNNFENCSVQNSNVNSDGIQHRQQPTTHHQILNNGNVITSSGSNLLNGIDFNVSQLYTEPLNVTGLFGMSHHLNGHLQNVGNLSSPSGVSHLAVAAAASTSLGGLTGLPVFPHHQSSIGSTAGNGNSLHNGLLTQMQQPTTIGELAIAARAHPGSNNSQNNNSSITRQRHRSSTGDSMFKCNYCPKKYSTQGLLHNHMDECRMIRMHECSQCGKRFKARGGLQQHGRIHVNDKPYHCRYCPKHFTQKSHLDQHERIHTGMKPFSCQFCGRAFRQRSQQMGHEATHASSSNNATSISGLALANQTLSLQQAAVMNSNNGGRDSQQNSLSSEQASLVGGDSSTQHSPINTNNHHSGSQHEQQQQQHMHSQQQQQQALHHQQQQFLIAQHQQQNQAAAVVFSAAAAAHAQQQMVAAALNGEKNGQYNNHHAAMLSMLQHRQQQQHTIGNNGGNTQITADSLLALKHSSENLQQTLELISSQ